MKERYNELVKLYGIKVAVRMVAREFKMTQKKVKEVLL